MKKWLIVAIILIFIAGLILFLWLQQKTEKNICASEYINQLNQISVIKGKLYQNKDGLYIDALKLEDLDYISSRFDEIREFTFKEVEVKGLLKKVPSGLSYIPGGQVPKGTCNERIAMTKIDYIILVNVCNDTKIILEGKFETIQSKYPIEVLRTAEKDYWIYGYNPDSNNSDIITKSKMENKSVKVEAILSPAKPYECNICYRASKGLGQCPGDVDLIYDLKIIE